MIPGRGVPRLKVAASFVVVVRIVVVAVVVEAVKSAILSEAYNRTSAADMGDTSYFIVSHVWSRKLYLSLTSCHFLFPAQQLLYISFASSSPFVRSFFPRSWFFYVTLFRTMSIV